jgi:CRP-like cAMP-binding protein
MSAPMKKRLPAGNRLLAALPRDQNEQFSALLSPVWVRAGEVLYEAGDQIQHAYFLNSGVASLLSTTEEGNVIEVGVVGSEGLIGTPILLRAEKMAVRVVMQIPGEAMMVKASVLRTEFNRIGRLQDLFLRYTHLLLTQFSLSGSCNRFHTVEQRLCRWLLSVQDRVQADSFLLTQELIAQMLGVSRPGVTLAASRLQKLELLSYSRGKITLLNRQGLESVTCGCYWALREGLEDFFRA